MRKRSALPSNATKEIGLRPGTWGVAQNLPCEAYGRPEAFRTSSGTAVKSIYSTFVPHSSQNFASGFRSFWHLAHFAGDCDAPHSLQNFASATIAAPHLTHFSVAADVAPAPSETVAPRCFIASVIAPAITLPTAKPAPSPAPNPAPPLGFCAASRMACAASNCVYLPMSPSTPIEVRLSIAASTSCGREMFSTTNFVSSKPSDLNSSSSFCFEKTLNSS